MALGRVQFMLIRIMLHTSISGSVTQSYESVDMQKRFAIASELQTFYTQEQKVPIFRDMVYKFRTRLYTGLALCIVKRGILAQG